MIKFGTFIELEAQAARDKAVEEPNQDQERIDRLMNEIDAAPALHERLPQAKRESLFSRFRAVQIIFAPFASKERFVSETCSPRLQELHINQKCISEAARKNTYGINSPRGGGGCSLEVDQYGAERNGAGV